MKAIIDPLDGHHTTDQLPRNWNELNESFLVFDTTRKAKMKRKRFSEEQFIGVLKEGEAGMSVSDIARKHGISEGSY